MGIPMVGTKKCVGKLISRTAKNKASDPDGIPNEALEELEKNAGVLLTKITNACHQLEYYPIAWKGAHTVILLKDKDRNLEPNEHHLNGLANLEQHTFRSGHSATTQHHPDLPHRRAKPRVQTSGCAVRYSKGF